MATSNKRLNEYVGFLNALNKAEMDAIKQAQGPMDPAMMMGGGAPPPMDPAMMGGGGMPMDPGMALGIPGGIDPAALGLVPPPPAAAPEGEPVAEEAATEAKEVADKALLEKALEVSDKAMDLAQAQTEKVDELIGSMETEIAPEMEEPPLSPEEMEALLAAKENSAEGII